MWIIRRKQKDLFEIALFPNSTQVIESYTLLKITNEEHEEFVSKGLWENVDGVLRIRALPRTTIYKLFFELAAAKLTGKPRIDVSKKVDSNVPGTSRLVRSTDRTKIYIAKRKGNKTLNQTRINSVCIDNRLREQFFDDVKAKHNYLPFLGKYELVSGDEDFNKWSAIMDEQYFWQIGK
jgi:hypothetical protein